MKKNQLGIIEASLLAAVSMTSGLAYADTSSSSSTSSGAPQITEVSVNYGSSDTISIRGGSFVDNGQGFKVTLGNFGELNVVSVAETEIVVDCPDNASGIPTCSGLEGDYLLTVLSGQAESPRLILPGTGSVTSVGVRLTYDLTLGTQGTPGPKGDTGAQGPAGPQGPVGPQGPAGPSGGATGPAGPQGPTGPQGPAGPAGPQGPAGQSGPQGPAGQPGAQGPMGATGVSGVSGLQIVTNQADIQGRQGVLDVNCPTGLKVISCAGQVPSDAKFFGAYPTSSASCEASGGSALVFAAGFHMQVWAVCAIVAD